MKVVFALISRNRKLFFKDRGMFFSALITPGILIEISPVLRDLITVISCY